MARCTSTPSLASGYQLVPWNIIDIDDVAGYDGAGGYVLDRAGLWLSIAHAARNSTAAASQPSLRWRLNGADVAFSRGVNVTAGQGLGGSCVFLGAAGDVIDLKVLLSSAVAATLIDDARWSVLRIGPKSWDF